jgi:AcrR family transcriptional regulator
VDWSPLRTPGTEPLPGQGLRERKKWRLRQQLSDTATVMFLERGFEAVRVTEIAAACDVSEKTVFNYFPTKESLILDRWDSTQQSLCAALADPATSPVDAALLVLTGELTAMTGWLAGQNDQGQDDQVQAAALFLRFGDLIWSTPSLRAYQHDTTGRLTAAAAQTLAQRAGSSPGDPEPQIAATALLGLWPVQFQSLRKHLKAGLAPPQLHQAVTADVQRAARLLDAGLQVYFTVK